MIRVSRRSAILRVHSMWFRNYPSSKSKIWSQMGHSFSEWKAREEGDKAEEMKESGKKKEGGRGRFSPFNLGIRSNCGCRSTLQTAYLTGCF